MVLDRLSVEKGRVGGLISDEALLRMIAVDFGCEIGGCEAVEPVPLFRDLFSGMNNVSAVGRVVAVFSSRSFDGKRKGKFASLLLADESGLMRVVLWNDQVSLLESGRVKVGNVVRFRHVYTREDYAGKVEMHAGEKCVVDVNPEDLKLKAYPSMRKFATKIADLSDIQKNSRVNVAGTVQRLGRVSEFERSDSSPGKVLRFTLTDASGEASLVVWNEKVDEVLEVLKVYREVQVVNGKLKPASDGLEVHVDGSTYVGADDSFDYSMLAGLKEGQSCVNVAGEVVTAPMIREVKTKNQEFLKLATFELKDESGRLWVSAWRDHAESVKDLKVGDRIVLKNVYVKRGFGDQLELSTRNGTTITKQV